MIPIATDTADFPFLRKDGCIYVDKTMYMHRRISTKGYKSIFVSRPRRFGKSLTISALKAFFQGRRELFEESLAFHVQDRLQESGFSYDGSRPPPENLGAAIKSLSAANGGDTSQFFMRKQRK